MKIDIEFNSGAQLPMDAIPRLAQLAEEHGFDCAWGGEANNKDPTVLLSANRCCDDAPQDRFGNLSHSRTKRLQPWRFGLWAWTSFRRDVFYWESDRPTQPLLGGMGKPSIVH